MKNIKFTILATILILAGCKNNPYEKYSGYWLAEREAIIQIKKLDDDKYIILNGSSILEKKDIGNDPVLMDEYNSPINKKGMIELKKIADDRLGMPYNSEIYPLTLSENNQELYSYSNEADSKITTFKKIDEKEAKKLIINAIKCMNLSIKKEDEIYELKRDNSSYVDENEINEKYKELSKNIKDCNI